MAADCFVATNFSFGVITWKKISGPSALAGRPLPLPGTSRTHTVIKVRNQDPLTIWLKVVFFQRIRITAGDL